jgi:hypothetical protein
MIFLRLHAQVSQFLFIPNGQLWPASGINATLPRIRPNGRWSTGARHGWRADHRQAGLAGKRGHWDRAQRRPTMRVGSSPQRRAGSSGREQQRSSLSPHRVSSAAIWRCNRWLELLAPSTRIMLIIPGVFAHRVQRPAEKINGLVLTGSPHRQGYLQSHSNTAWTLEFFKEVSPHLMGITGHVKRGLPDPGGARRNRSTIRSRGLLRRLWLRRRTWSGSIEFYARLPPTPDGGHYPRNHVSMGITCQPTTDGHYVCGTGCPTASMRPAGVSYGRRGIGGIAVVAYLAGYDLSAFNVQPPGKRRRSGEWRMPGVCEDARPGCAGGGPAAVAGYVADGAL